MNKLNVFTQEKESLDTLGGGKIACGIINDNQFLIAVSIVLIPKRDITFFTFIHLNPILKK
ncbi:MAG: hypothetical protein R2799_06775 [Crocinitomicaceae bacterium]